MGYEIPTWIFENPRQQRSTEILLPVVMGIAPVVQHSPEHREGWFARLDVVPDYLDEPIWECGHIHSDQSDAWTCAEAGARMITTAALARIR